MKELAKVNLKSVLFDICDKFETFFTDKACKLNLGYYGKDSPPALIKTVLQKMKKEESYLDALIINGDFAKHGTVLPELKGSNKKYSKHQLKKSFTKQKAIIDKTLDIVRD